MKLFKTRMPSKLFLLLAGLLEIVFILVSRNFRTTDMEPFAFWIGVILLPLLVLFQWINTGPKENTQNNFLPAILVFFIGYGAAIILLIKGFSTSALTALIITLFLGLDKPWNFDFKKVIASGILILFMAFLGYLGEHLLLEAKRQPQPPIETAKIVVLESSISESDIKVDEVFRTGDTLILQMQSGKITIKNRP